MGQVISYSTTLVMHDVQNDLVCLKVEQNQSDV